MKNALEAFWLSVLRTFVPIVVGTVVSWLTVRGIELDPEFEVTLSAMLFAAAAVLWHAVARLLETFVSPKFGVLLGSTKRPEYAEAPPKARPHG